jgi:hypothetical protein
MEDINLRVDRLEEKVNNMDISISVFASVIDHFEKTIEKLDCTLDKTSLNQAAIQTQFQSMADDLKSLKADNNVSILGLLKSHFIELIAIGGIVLYLSGIIKF